MKNIERILKGDVDEYLTIYEGKFEKDESERRMLKSYGIQGVLQIGGE